MKSQLVIVFAVLMICVVCHSPMATAKVVFINETFVVEPGAFKWFPFFSAKKTGVRVTGAFRARGGSRNDIEVYIFDDIGLENFANRNSAENYYYSRKVTAGRIDVFLPANKYYIVFNNRFSSISNKAVKAYIELD